jgi:hypothetical protein
MPQKSSDIARRTNRNKRILQHYKKIFSLKADETAQDYLIASFLAIQKQQLDI